MVISPNRGKLDFDFWVGRTDASTFPANEWRRILDAKVRYGGARLAEYQDPQGLLELRQAVADHIGPARGVSARPEHIIVVNGSQDGLSLISRVFAGYARTFVHEDPCYQGARYLFQSCGFPMQPVPVDNDGIDVDRLPKTRRSLLYVTPSHQYPLGVTLSLERRLKLLEWAARTDSFIIEDDYDGDFRYEGAPLTALRGLDRGGRVLYLGTFSKSLAAGLRLGFIVAPPVLASSLREWKSLASNGTPWLEQSAMAEFMNSGGFIRHLRRIRAIYKTRRDLVATSLRQSFGDAEIKGLRGGMHLSLRVPRRFGGAVEIEKEAAQRGVGIYTPGKGGAFISPNHPRADDTLLFGYAALPEKHIRTAMAKLAEIAAARERVLVNG
jgi:GntR family transcriptional regulator/MocR family aminotransferase